MSDPKKTDELDDIRRKMPDGYASLIAEEIGDPDFTREAVRRVFRKQTTHPDTVLKVLTAAKKVIDRQNEIDNLKKDIASSLA